MLNANSERELAYVVIINGIEPIPGYDRVEHAIVGGWRVIVQKDQFKPGDPAIYFEIDSRVPSDKECFAFLEKRHYKVKTLKMCKTLSQGLLMHASDFGWTIKNSVIDDHPVIIDDEGKPHYATDESRFLTKKLGVTYADDEDNARKAAPVDKYKKMASRHQKLFKKPFIRWIMRHSWGRKILFFFFGKKKDKKNGWPSWVQKTDEERVQNMPWILNSTDKWIATEKIDGTSTTFTMKRGKFGRKSFYVCSRNVCFGEENKPCYYDTNVYWEMAKKYDIYNVLSTMLDIFPNEEWITIQGETYGDGVQKRDYSLKDHEFAAFNLIFSSRGRVSTLEMIDLLWKKYTIPCVPVVEENIDFTNKFATVEDMLLWAEGNSKLDGLSREGIVFRTTDGQKSFKAVSNSFLLKYHG
ncbi:MAG: hypothetical protein LIR46_00280 [Bacteroidota bacterium]|nr:hypothetical protein [Bacteroidota bacterium]